MTIASEFEAKFAGSWPAKQWRELTIIVAISGGADSVALLKAMLSICEEGAGEIVVAHFNHRMRGEASDADEQFVIELCRNHSVACEVGRAETTIEAASGEGLESTLRNARYDFLKASAARQGARFVATAHTADDQAETILHRIIRGTSVAGLAGIRRARELAPTVTLIRPLLNFRRDEIVCYLQSIGQPYCEDASNKDPRFTRNRIRAELIPYLTEDYNRQVIDSLLRLGTLASETQEVIDSVVSHLKDQVVRVKSDGASVDCLKLAMHSDFVQREVLKSIWRSQHWPEQSMSCDHWLLLSSLAANNNSEDVATMHLPGLIIARKKGGQLTLTRPKN